MKILPMLFNPIFSVLVGKIMGIITDLPTVKFGNNLVTLKNVAITRFDYVK